MRSLKVAAAAAIALLGGAVLAAPAQAQTAPIIEYRTEGGFVRWNTTPKVFSGGFVIAAEAGVSSGEALIMPGYLPAGQVTALKNAFTTAHFSSLPAQVHMRTTIMDMSTQVLKFR